MRRSPMAVLIMLAFLLPGALAAQESPSTPQTPEQAPEFRPGQWSGLFSLESGTYGVGAMRFSTPDRAWVYMGAVTADHDDNPSATSMNTSLTVGRRVFGAPRGRVRAYHEFGGGLSLGYGEQDIGPSTQHRVSYGVTAHALLGGALFVARDISIGAEWGINAGYFHSKYTYDDPFPDETRDYWSISAGDITLVGAFYF